MLIELTGWMIWFGLAKHLTGLMLAISPDGAA